MKIGKYLKWVVLGLFTCVYLTSGAFAFDYPLGDIGKPADYNRTIRSFSVEIPNYKDYLDQLPTSWNWMAQGKVTPAKDQGNCGGCWSFASAGTFESKMRMAGQAVYDLSEQQQLSCNT